MQEQRSEAVPMFRISVINEDFTAIEERDLPNAAAARDEAIRGAIAMGADHISAGGTLFGAMVSVTEENEPMRRFVITVGASPLRLS